MTALLVMTAPLLVGFLLILIIARFAPNVPREASLAPGEAADDRPEISSEEFRDLVDELVGALGFETVFSSLGTGGVVEMTLRDRRPLAGGRILLHASPVLRGQLDAADVLGFAEGVRADAGALKGILIALAGFTEEATTAAQSSAALDLVDGPALLALVREHLCTDRAEGLARYRGFGKRGAT
jgi:restriction system protein